ncbi:unnamed protein product, partial [Amoebophrya sp. A25]
AKKCANFQNNSFSGNHPEKNTIFFCCLLVYKSANIYVRGLNRARGPNLRTKRSTGTGPAL